MIVKIDEIRKITNLLFQKMVENHGESIELTNDFYWDIPTEQRYNCYSKPEELTIGQVSDDLNGLLRLLQVEEYPISYELKRLAEVFKAISVQNI